MRHASVMRDVLAACESHGPGPGPLNTHGSTDRTDQRLEDPLSKTHQNIKTIKQPSGQVGVSQLGNVYNAEVQFDFFGHRPSQGYS